MDSIVLFSIPLDELKNIIKAAVQEEFSLKKEKELLNFRETCQFLGISASALNKWKKKNLVPFKKMGKRIFFNKKELLQSLENSRYSKLKNLNSESV